MCSNGVPQTLQKDKSTTFETTSSAPAVVVYFNGKHFIRSSTSSLNYLQVSNSRWYFYHNSCAIIERANFFIVINNDFKDSIAELHV